jgi:hypothetical protein
LVIQAQVCCHVAASLEMAFPGTEPM